MTDNHNPNLCNWLCLIHREQKETDWNENTKTKFMKFFNKLPEKARQELVYDFAIHPITLNVCMMEVKHNTKLGKEILRKLGFEE